jgi:hypothetical protein
MGRLPDHHQEHHDREVGSLTVDFVLSKKEVGRRLAIVCPPSRHLSFERSDAMTSHKKSSKSEPIRQGLFSNEHRAAIERLRDTGQYIMFSRQLFKLGLNIIESVALQDMMNYAAMVYASIKNEGWFTYTVKDMQDRTTLDRRQQQAVINTLKRAKLIKTAKRGNPAKRHVWIDLARIENRLTKILNSECATQ